MKLILICGNRAPHVLEELSSLFPKVYCQSYNSVESLILDLKKGSYSRESVEIILTDEGFINTDYEAALMVLNSLTRKRSATMKLLLLTRNKKLYFCWKVFSEKNGNMQQEYTPDPVITSGHILFYAIPYLTKALSADEKSDSNPPEAIRQTLNTSETADQWLKNGLGKELSLDSNTCSHILKDQNICFTGSDWSLVLEIEKLVSSFSSQHKAPHTFSIKSKDLPESIHNWERVYLVDDAASTKSMENQTLLLFLQSYLPKKVINKKIRILEADKSSSKILLYSVNDFLTRY